MFEKIKKWYEQKLWTQTMIENAYKKGVITAKEKKQIIESEVV